MQKLTGWNKIMELSEFTSEIFELFIIWSLMYKISFICYCLQPVTSIYSKPSPQVY